MYTLTLSNNRNKVLLAKILVISLFAIVFTLLFGSLYPLVTSLGVHAHHLKLVPQTLHYGTLFWHCLFFGWGYTMAGLLLAALIRNQVGALITFLIGPGTIEGLLSLWLKKKVVYLPFSALHEVIGQGENYNKTISPARGAFIFACYLIVGWVVAWILFLRRDVA
jgi:ABC-type transport system involved in multi-copper enzyme maturation permease subunit